MQEEKSFEDLFGIKGTQCSHIINVDFHSNPKIEPVPLHKGNLFLGGVSSFKEPIINGFRITAVLSILDEQMIKRYKIKEKIEHLQVIKHKWIDLEDEENIKIALHFE
mgnify:CR=1 FL=1